MLAVFVTHLRKSWLGLMRELSDPYRPELHYMRGPGPKYRARHGARHPSPGAGQPDRTEATS